MGYETSSTSQNGQGADDRDEDDEDEYEEVDGDNRLLGFMFGNVDGSGDLDVDYLDEDAKEHLAALADKLGSSLTDIDLSVKSSQTSVDAAEQDYDKKAEDAVDYEDIDEQYEGPEIQAVTEEDYLLPKKDYFSSKVSAATSTSVFDDENYDDDDELEKAHEAVDNNSGVQTTTLSGEHVDKVAVLSPEEKSLEEKSPEENSSEDGQTICALETENVVTDLADFQKEEADTLEEPVEAKISTPLPVLCIEDGTVILRFSEIFAIHEPLKKAEKRDHWYSVTKEKYKALDITDIVEEDEEAFLKGSSQSFSSKVPARVIPDDVLTYEDESEFSKVKVVQGDGAVGLQVDGPRKDSCHSAVPMNEDLELDLSVEWNKPSCPDYYPLDQQDWENKHHG